ncbi:MAG: glycosyltransferase family 2 protein, partial [Myxococcales bacterium]
MKRVTIVLPCFNEEDNLRELYRRLTDTTRTLNDRYVFEFLFIDNASTDGTVAVLRELAASDARVKAIVNARNFGHIRSPYYGLLQAEGDVTAVMATDLQDPPELLPEFLKKWEEGYRVVVGVKAKSEESFVFYSLRSLYYRTLGKLSEVELIQ